MKTIKLIMFVLAFVQMTTAQSKSDLLEQIEIYQASVYQNKSYDVDRAKVFDAMNQVGALEYAKVVRESESRGFCEWTVEKDNYKETLTMEIINDKQPYRVNYSIKTESRILLYGGGYSEWKTSSEMPKRYLNKLQHEMYYTLFGAIKLPEELLQKIEAYNKTQTKQKKQLLQGRDY